MRSIAVLNQKGGVGKTTTAVNLSAALADAGQRVCLIDLDPQAHASLHLGVVKSDEEPSIYDVLTRDCPIAKVRQQDSRVGYATVYRTLRLLAECELANVRHFGDGVTRYEVADEGEHHHDHLICTDCKRIVEFEDEAIEVLQDRVAERYGFALRSHKHELYGVCPDCQKAKA